MIRFSLDCIMTNKQIIKVPLFTENLTIYLPIKLTSKFFIYLGTTFLDMAIDKHVTN